MEILRFLRNLWSLIKKKIVSGLKKWFCGNNFQVDAKTSAKFLLLSLPELRSTKQKHLIFYVHSEPYGVWGRIKALCLRQFYDWCGNLLRRPQCILRQPQLVFYLIVDNWTFGNPLEGVIKIVGNGKHAPFISPQKSFQLAMISLQGMAWLPFQN